MRDPVPFLDTHAMPWMKPGPPGIYSKLLSRDPVTGERTALNRLQPEEGMNPPGAAHYHHTTEELLIVKGRMSFDSQVWLTPQSYCFHPPETVHGFKSAVPEESWFLSRVGRELDFNFVEEPERLSPYYVSEAPPRRIVAYHAELPDEDWESQGTFDRFVLSLDPATNEGSVLLRAKPGWSSGQEGEKLCRFEEFYILEGEVSGSDGNVFGEGCYCFDPPGTPRRELTCKDSALLYFTVGPRER
ncbi:MAG: hypothetical protein RIF37_01500 [Rhodospirillaceae bacterium]|jgi:quercetin dioxygenase-like cupin family protein